jgi:type II secretory pathway pseudopilin PulG
MVQWKLPAERRRAGAASNTGRSLAFMAELLIMLLFFLLAGSITALVFVRSYTISQDAAQKQEALRIAHNAYEVARYAADRPEVLQSVLKLSEENGIYTTKQNDVSLFVSILETLAPAGRIYTADIRVENHRGEILTQTKAARYVSFADSPGGN